MIYKNKDGRGIGKLSGNVFTKTVSKKKHLMKALYSWGMDKAVLDTLGDNVRIEIFDKDENQLYTTNAKKFREEGKVWDFGYGEQVFLELYKFMTSHKNGG